jgi:uroporphyrin-III C-methyltransferase
MVGKVSLVGAGPGDPELLTVKALRAIENAQAVVYDRLVADAILELIPAGVPRFFAGKSCKQRAMTQEEINALLITLAGKDLRVVRLKGGDPFLFGRGGEEGLELAKSNIPFDIIPGITSAQGCGAYAGIPLTHRGLATGVRFFTGHRMNSEDAEEPLELDWKSMSDPDTTLVVYMGLANLGTIAEKLIEHGLPASTPAAAIRQGTTDEQILIISTLSKLADEVARAKLEPPVLVIIGKVVSLSEKLQWVKSGEKKPAKSATSDC